jgi:hypothetical protein
MIIVTGAGHNKILFCEDPNLAISSRRAIGQANLIKRHFAADCLSEFGVALLLRGSESAPGSFEGFVEALVSRIGRG